MMETRTINTALLELNHGQLDGLPSNPRQVSKERLEALKKSILDAPEMLRLREPIVFPLGNGHFIVIGGNMRIRACKELGMEEMTCKVLDKGTPIEKLREYVIKDNNATGEDDWSILSAEWDTEEIAAWGLSNDSAWMQAEKVSRKEHNPTSRAKGLNWGRDGDESRCNLLPHLAVHEKNGALILSSFKKTVEGIPLSELKQDPANVGVFAKAAVLMIRGIIRLRQVNNVALITAPKRRHKKSNFAENVCREVSKQTGLRFYPNAIRSHNRDRLHPIFTLETCIMESFVILYDDILTTGSTIRHVLELFQDKNVIVIIGINNNQ